MTRDEAMAISQKIWDGVAKDTAYVWLVNDDLVPDERLGKAYRVEGNENGLLRLTAELLNAIGTGNSPCDYLFHSSPILTRIIRATTTEPPQLDAKPLPKWKRNLGAVGCGAFLLFAAACMIVGFAVIVTKVF